MSGSVSLVCEERLMKKLILTLFSFLFILSCSDGSDMQKARLSACMKSDSTGSFSMKEITEDDIKAHTGDTIKITEPFAEIISLDDNGLVIEYAKDFNCSNTQDIYVATSFDEEDESVLNLEIEIDYHNEWATCVCPKVIRFTVKGDPERLAKIKKLKREDGDQVYYCELTRD